MSGMAGNKGAVAIRMDFANTSLCFVTAHLAAGFSNYEERNRDYRTIAQGLRFQRNRSIDDHDSVIWFGDFNYRIGLSNEKVRAYIDRGDLDTLFDNDQLYIQRTRSNIHDVFDHYDESKITFLPTYKFDIGTDTYDTSDKARIPAWTDRVLRKGLNLRQINYNSAPLKFSDHRPVYATFQCDVSMVNEAYRDKLNLDLYRKRKAVVGDRTASADVQPSDEEDLLGYESVSAPRSDPTRWWLNGGMFSPA
jgi:endonuclease/exonuclease/phosphatase family metal-dependent hydrolase